MVCQRILKFMIHGPFHSYLMKRKTIIFNIFICIGSQGVTFPSGLQVLPTGYLSISQDIQLKCPVGLSEIVLEGGKGTLNYNKSNYLGLQIAY